MTSVRTIKHGEDRAVKLTKDNRFEIEAWAKKAGGTVEVYVDETKPRVRVKVKGKGWRVAHVGDLVVKHLEGKVADFYVVKAT